MSNIIEYIKEVSRIPIRYLLYSGDRYKYLSYITKLYYY